MTILWPYIAYIIERAQALAQIGPMPISWGERVLWFLTTAALVVNQIFGVVGKRKSEIHTTDLAHIASLQGLLNTKKQELEEEKTARQTAEVEKQALAESLAQAKKELTALALIEVGKLLNFAQERADKVAAETECIRLRGLLAESELEHTRSDVARKSGEYRRERR